MGDEMDDLTYQVPAISCGHCVNAITDEVMKVEGVRELEIDLETKMVLVRGSDLDDGAIRAAIDEAGYEVAT